MNLIDGIDLETVKKADGWQRMHLPAFESDAIPPSLPRLGLMQEGARKKTTADGDATNHRPVKPAQS